MEMDKKRDSDFGAERDSSNWKQRLVNKKQMILSRDKV
jgi:hypothetical protein